MLADWIVEHMADHQTFVEVFGGGAAVLFNKPRSDREVYNDIDSDLVNFFRVLQGREAELIEWLQRVPFSRELHEKWATEMYETDMRDEDPVERAGRFYLVRYTQYFGEHGEKTDFHHFGGEKANAFAKAVDRMPQFAERIRGVAVEKLDYRDLIDNYDSEDTLFYFDPLFLDGSSDKKFSSGEWDADAFIETVDEIEGKWMVSCLEDEIPQHWLDDDQITYVSRKYKQYDETIQMNYDPSGVLTIEDANMSGGDALEW